MTAARAPERLSILVVEDNPADADLVREMLRDTDLVAAGAVSPDVHLVDTLRGALDAAKDHFDVALLDLGLPDANGLEGLSALSAAVPELPAVVLTGARDPALAARALVAGAEDFLVKGEIEGELLLRSLRFAVARHRRGSSRRPLLAARGRGEREATPGGQVSYRAAAPATSASHSPALAAHAAPRSDAPERRVLLVEDNPGDAELVRIALPEGGFAIHHVERLGDALAALSSRELDVVVLDLCLPDATGVGCVEKIRAAFPEIPVVVLTGDPGPGLAAVRSGVQEYVVKGELDLAADLQRAIDYAIERNRHGQRVRELAAERAAHAATQAAAEALRYANERLALATREAREALEREAAARAEADRRRQEIEALFASMIDPVLVLGADRRIESTNPAVARLFGFDPRGLTPTEFIEAADMRSDDGARMPPSALPSARALDGTIVPSERVHVRTPAGKRVLIVSASPVWRGDSVQGAVCVYRDVTEQDRAEQALRESDERKDHFLAMLAHELRNPLAPIVNGVYILERAAPGGAQAHRALNVIDRQVQHLSRLVDDLLDVTRISRGKIDLQRERLDLSALVHQVVEDHRSIFVDRGVELEASAGATPLQVSGDRTRLAQVLGNLLHNSAKFTPRGGRVSVSVEGAGAGSAAIRVRDTGEGIEPATLGQVFEPFVQGDTTLDRKHGGLGLGLALVRGLAELHGGTATAYSQGRGKGAEFVIALPLERAAEESPSGAAPAPTVPARRILVIEDNVDAAESLKEVLEMSDHLVEIAHSGPEGIEKARAFRPEVVLCDIGLPVMDGFEVASAMRADPALGAIAIVALSGYAAPADLERAADAGFDRHLAKPVDWGELERVMGEVAALRAR